MIAMVDARKAVLASATLNQVCGCTNWPVTSNQPFELTLPRCALQRSSRARWADAGWAMAPRPLATIRIPFRVPKDKNDSAKVETRSSSLTQDQLLLNERMAYQE